MPKHARAPAPPISDLAALLDPSAQAAEEPSSAPLPSLPPPERAPVDEPNERSMLDVSAETLLAWFQPLRALPTVRADGFGGRDLVLPYSVLLIAAVLARGSEQRAVHADLVAGAFPLGVVHACMPILQARGFVRFDPSSGIVTILNTPAPL